MRIVLVVILVLLACDMPSSYANDGLGKVYRIGSKKGQKIPTTVQRQNKYFEDTSAALDVMNSSLDKNIKLLEKLVEGNEVLAERLANALGTIAKLMKENNQLQKENIKLQQVTVTP